jgi:spermidine synthase
VDGYEDETTPSALVSQAFFDAAWCALQEPGALVINFMDDDRELDRHLQRLERAFGGAVLAFHALVDPNVIVIALKGAPPRLAWDLLGRRAQALERRLGLPFTRMLPRFRRMNRCDAEALIIAGQAEAP